MVSVIGLIKYIRKVYRLVGVYMGRARDRCRVLFLLEGVGRRWMLFFLKRYEYILEFVRGFFRKRLRFVR